MEGIIRIDRVVSQFEVWLDESFPFAKMRVKVLERSQGEYLAVPNLAVKDKLTNEPDYISGLGVDPDEALKDLLFRFVDLVRENTPAGGLKEANFEWSAPEDF